MTSRPIRWATAADVPELVRVINAAFRVEDFFIDGNRTDAADVAERVARSNAGFLVVDGVAPGSIAGTVYVEVNGPRGYFGLLSIEPGVQGTGVGRFLMEAAETHCRNAGCTTLEITVVDLREELFGYYERFGLARSGTEPFPYPERLTRDAHLVVMSKPL